MAVMPDDVKEIERYGLLWPARLANDLNIELTCYRDAIETGQTPEYHFRQAWRIMWPGFAWNEWTDMMVWAWCNYRRICVIGHASAGKTFSFAHCALLDFLAAPESTATTFTTTKFDALKTRLWGDFKYAIEHSAQREAIVTGFRVTDTTNELKFGMASRKRLTDDRYIVQGVATDSADTTAGKIRGQHADRRRIIGDEAQNIAESIYTAISNAATARDFKCALLSNPTEWESEFGKWCEPRAGRSSITDSTLFWETTKPNGICLHFDGLQSPNIKAGRTIYPFLLTQQYVDDQRHSEGENSPRWWMFVRGMFPPDGVVAKVWPATTIERAKQTIIFDFAPIGFATLDPAFEFDDCVLHLGHMGIRRDGKPCAMAEKTVKITTREGPGELTKDRQIANEVIRVCKEYGVKSEHYIQDTTGNARGVYAMLLESDWGKNAKGVSYGGEATERPLRLNDSKKAEDEVKYFVSELWFRASFLARDGIICGLGNLDQKTATDLAARIYSIKDNLMVVESKKEMKKRLGRSPDYGDAFCQIGELLAQCGYLEKVSTNVGGQNWARQRAAARKAAQRYTNEFSHGASS